VRSFPSDNPIGGEKICGAYVAVAVTAVTVMAADMAAEVLLY
jgi:hypothetical protein